MNRIKSLLGLLSIVLALMSYPLGAEAQTVTVPPGTDPSVRLLGQIYAETGDQVKESQDVDNLLDYSTKITEKYALYIDTDVKLNNSDRKYLAECLMYAFTQCFRCTCKQEGLDPDDPIVKHFLDQQIKDMSNQAKNKLAGAETVGDALSVLETAFE